MAMLVSARGARRCCRRCGTDYGQGGTVGVANRKAVAGERKRLRRTLKRRERQQKEWLRDW